MTGPQFREMVKSQKTVSNTCGFLLLGLQNSSSKQKKMARKWKMLHEDWYFFWNSLFYLIFPHFEVRMSLVELLFIVFFYCLCEHAVHSNYWLFTLLSSFIFDREKWGCKWVYWDTICFCPHYLNLMTKRNIFL